MITYSCPIGGPPSTLLQASPDPYGTTDSLLFQEQTFLWRRQMKAAFKRNSAFMKEYPGDKNPIRNFDAFKSEGTVTFGWHPEIGWSLIHGEKGFGYEYTADGTTTFYLNVKDSGEVSRRDFFGPGKDYFTSYRLASTDEWDDDRTSYVMDFWALAYFGEIDLTGTTMVFIQFYTFVYTADSDIVNFAVWTFNQEWKGKPDGNPSFDIDSIRKLIREMVQFKGYWRNYRLEPGVFTPIVPEPAPFISVFEEIPYSSRLSWFIDDVNTRLGWYMPTFEDFDNSLVEKAIADSRPNTSNWLETAIGSKALLPSLVRAVSRVQGGILGTIQRFAGSYLFYLYGLRPIPSDLENLKNAISIAKGLKSYPEWTFSSTSELVKEEWSGTQAVFIKCRGISHDSFDPMSDNLTVGGLVNAQKRGNRSQLNRNLNLMADAGIPTDIFSFLSMIWDLLSLSFVFDWFLNIGGLLDAFSLRKYYDRLSILYVRRTIHAYKDERLTFIERAGVYGLEVPNTSVQSELYRREYSKTPPPLGPPKLDDPTFSKHWIELGAIVVARLK